MRNWQITDFEAGQPLLDALALRVPAAPRAFLHQAIRKGRVQCGSQTVAADLPVGGGMRLTVHTSARFEELISRCGVPPESLLYEDRHALVIDKPAGLALHRAAGHDDNLADRVAHFVALRHAVYRTAPVHRLDIGTSGAVLFGKGRWAVGQLGRLLMAGRISKHYLALVRGAVPARGELTTPVAEGGRMKPALTRYRRLAATGSASLLELELVTGRQHQARRQLADAGWPIIGDRRYGGAAWPVQERPFLHCHQLQFPALDDGLLRQVVSPLPALLVQVLAAAGIGAPPFRGEENTAAAPRERV